MSKTIFISTILVVFVAITVWLVVQKTREGGKITETPASTTTPISTPTPTQGSSEPVQYEYGLIVQDVVVGSGKTAESGDTLSANYLGVLKNGTKFDSSYDRGEPISFVLGAGQLIKGWELGLVGMKEGGKRKLIISPSLGYGSKGAGGVIPPNATLVFEIELMSVIKK